MASIEKLLVKGVISELPVSDQVLIKECAEKIRAVIAEYGDHGYIALTLVVTD
jgi:hypothetical protein